MTSDNFGGDGDEDFEDDDDNIYIMMKFCLSVLTFYPNVTKIHSLKICLSRKINTFQLGSSLTPLYPSLISSTPLGPMRHSKSLYPQEGQWGGPRRDSRAVRHQNS